LRGYETAARRRGQGIARECAPGDGSMASQNIMAPKSRGVASETRQIPDRCERCGKPAKPCEMVAYRGLCENCFVNTHKAPMRRLSLRRRAE